MMKIRLTLFVGICLLGIVLVTGCEPPQPTQAEKQVLKWLRTDGCQVEKLESGIYRISWWEGDTFDPSDLVQRTWNPRRDSYEDLNGIKQEFKNFKEIYSALLKAEPELNWLRDNGCEVTNVDTIIYTISWTTESSTPGSVDWNGDSFNVTPESHVVRNHSFSWRPGQDSYDDLIKIREDFQEDKEAGHVSPR